MSAMKRIGFCAVAVVAALAAAMANAARKPPAHKAVLAPYAAVDARHLAVGRRQERHFLQAAAAANRFEGQAARMALAKSDDPRVRSFAAMLINHHASSGNALLYMLHARSMALPMLANDQRKTLNRLAKLQGTKFDREFMAEVGLRYQQDDVRNFEQASLAASEPVLKAWIGRMLPTLRFHLATAERIAADEARAGISPVAVRPIESNTR